jgi:fibronectin-binding autotransporter adhesin
MIRTRIVALSLAIAFATAMPAFAQNLYWDTNSGTAGAGATPTGTWGVNNFWNTDASGTGSSFTSTTTSTNNLFFVAGPSATSGQNFFTVTISGSQSANSITFQAAGAPTISGSNTPLSLGSGGLIMSSSAYSNVAQGGVTFNNVAFTLLASQTWSNNSNSTQLTVSTGTIPTSINNNGFDLTLNTTQQLTPLSQSMAIGGTAAGIIGSGGLIKNGSGYVYLTTGSSTYGGVTTINDGAILIQNANQIGANNLTINGGNLELRFGTAFNRVVGSGSNQVQLTGGTSGFSGQGGSTSPLTLNSTGTAIVWGSAVFNPSAFLLQSRYTNTNGSMTVSGSAIDLNGGNRTIRSEQAAGDVISAIATVNNSFVNSTGTASLIKTGVGQTVLNGTNTYNGGTQINEGTLRFATRLAMPTSGTVQVNNGGTLGLTITGTGLTGWTDATSGTGSLGGALAGTGLSPSGGFTYSGTVGILLNVTASSTYAGVLSDLGSGPTRYAKIGASSIVLSGSNTYSGSTAILQGMVQFGQQASLYGGTTASWTASNINVANSGTLALNVGGTNEFTTGNVTTLLTNLASSTSATNGMNGGSVLGFDTTNASGGSFTIADVLANTTGASGGARGLTKLGTGQLLLTATNTYTGATTVTGGTLAISGVGRLGASGASAVTLSGGQLDLGNTTQTIGALTISASSAGNTIQSGTLSAPSYTVTNGSGTATVAAVLSGTAGLTKSGAGRLALADANTYTGTTNITAGTLQIGTGGTTGSLSTSSVITGAAGGVLAFNRSDTLNSGTTFANLIGGGIGVSQLGSGTVVLYGANTYTGTTTVGAGVLSISGAGRLGTSGSSALALTGGRLDLGGTTQTVGAVTVSAAAASGNTIESGTLSAPSYAATNTSGTATLAATLTGTGNLTKSNAGAILLTAANTYTGTTTVSGGILAVSGAGRLGTSGSSAIVLSGGQLDLGTTSQTVGPVTISSAFASGNTLQGGTMTAPSYAATNTTGTATVTTVLAGTAGLTKSGVGGALALSGNNTYTGLTTGSGGTLTLSGSSASSGFFLSGNVVTRLNINSPTALGSGTLMITNGNNVSIDNTSGTAVTLSTTNGQTWGNDFTFVGSNNLNLGTGTVAMLGTRNVTTTSGTLTVGGAISGTNTTFGLTKSGAGTLVLSGSNTYTGATTVNAGVLQLGNGGATGSLSLSSTITGAVGATLAFNRSNTVTQGVDFLSGTSFGGPLNVTQLGSGTVVFTGTNIYTGTTTVVNGVAQFATVTSLNGGTSAQWVQTRINVRNGATLALNVGGTGEFTTGTIGALLTNLASSTSAVTGMNAGSFYGFDTTNASSGTFTISNFIGNSTGASGGARGVVKLGSNTLSLTSATNSYTGGTLLRGGTLAFVTGAIGSSGSIAFQANSTLAWSGSNTTDVSSRIVMTNGVTSGIDTGTNTVSFASGIGDATSGGLTKLGSGKLVLAGSNSYTGNTTVSTGTLAVNGVLGSGTVSVAAAAWLQGTGTIAGPVSVSGNLSPGNSPGILTVGSLTLLGSSTTSIEINDIVRGVSYDGIDITGTSSPLTYGGVLSIAFGNASAFANGQTFDIFNFTSLFSGSFSSVTSSGFYAGSWTDIGSGTYQFVSGGQTLTFSPSTGDIIVVPEPATLAVVGLGLVGGAAALRRRRMARRG